MKPSEDAKDQDPLSHGVAVKELKVSCHSKKSMDFTNISRLWEPSHLVEVPQQQPISAPCLTRNFPRLLRATNPTPDPSPTELEGNFNVCMCSSC